MPAFDIVRRWRGRTVSDRAGQKLGRLVEVYYDAEADEPGWALLNTADIGASMHLVPLAGAVEQGEGLRLAHDQATVLRAPGMDEGGRLSPREEAELYAYWGLAYSGASLDDLDEPDDEPPVQDELGVTRLRRRAGR